MCIQVGVCVARVIGLSGLKEYYSTDGECVVCRLRTECRLGILLEMMRSVKTM